MILAGAALLPFNYLVGVDLGPANVRALHLWAPVALAVGLVFRPRTQVGTLAPITLLFATTAMAVALSTLLATPADYRTRGMLDCLMLALNVLAFAVTYANLAADSELWQSFFQMLVGASAVASIMLVAQALTATTTGTLRDDASAFGLGTVTGTYVTAFAAAAAVSVAFVTSGKARIIALVALGLHTVAATLALARGPWVGFALALTVVVPLGLWVRPGKTLLGPIGRLATAGVLVGLSVGTLFIFNPAALRIALVRVLQIANLSSGTGLTRVNLFNALLTDALESPVFGHGASAYRRTSELIGVQGSISENFALEMFHAGGLVAALPFLVGLGLVVMATFRAVRSAAWGTMALLCLGALIAMLFGAMTNPAAWNASYWVTLAMCAALDPVARSGTRSKASPHDVGPGGHLTAREAFPPGSRSVADLPEGLTG